MVPAAAQKRRLCPAVSARRSTTSNGCPATTPQPRPAGPTKVPDQSRRDGGVRLRRRRAKQQLGTDHMRKDRNTAQHAQRVRSGRLCIAVVQRVRSAWSNRTACGCQLSHFVPTQPRLRRPPHSSISEKGPVANGSARAFGGLVSVQLATDKSAAKSTSARAVEQRLAVLLIRSVPHKAEVSGSRGPRYCQRTLM